MNKMKKLLCLASNGELIKDGKNIFLRFREDSEYIVFKTFFIKRRLYLSPCVYNKASLIKFIINNYFLIDCFLEPCFKDSEIYEIALESLKQLESFKYINHEQN